MDTVVKTTFKSSPQVVCQFISALENRSARIAPETPLAVYFGFRADSENKLYGVN